MSRADSSSATLSREAKSAAPLLQLAGVSAGYGDVQVLWEIDLAIGQGEIVALVGPNGAGKSTTLSAISGIVRPRAGRIMFDGQPIHEATTKRIVELGIAHVPEGRRLFSALSVRDNLLMGAFQRRDKAQIADDLARTLDLFPRLKERLRALGGNLSGGEQQMVAIGRGLMSRPRLLMIDELSLGLAPVIVESLFEILGQVHRDGTAILIVEQDVQAALELATHGYVLETGQITLSGTSASLLGDERVKQAYLGL
ncbi:MAG: ABC transporter ATP-binding protein [Thermomicrobiales bacterium]